MPKQNDEPVTVKQTLTEQDYAAASAAVGYFAAPMRRRTVRAALCLTVSALTASVIPACGGYSAARVVGAIAILCAAAAIAVWFGQPVADRRRAGRWFRSCPLAALPAEVTVSGDRAVVKSECERMTEYWTDFSVCVETDELIAAAGGRERFLLIVKKSGLSKEEAGRLSGLFRYAFDGRWYRMNGKNGKGGK